MLTIEINISNCSSALSWQRHTFKMFYLGAMSVASSKRVRRSLNQCFP